MTMKKYIKPEIVTVVITTAKPVLLNASGEYTSGTILAPELENIEFNY